ncbi:hypothetical protein AMTRI_Chr09g39120 [Amborella trichopoda]
MRRRRRLPPLPPPFPGRPSHPALAHPSPSTPTPSRLHSSWSPTAPSFWNRICKLYPKPLCVPHKASPKVLPTTVSGPPVSVALVVARSSPSLPLAGSSVCPKEPPSSLCSQPPLGPFFISIPFEESSSLKAKFQSF